MPPQTASDGISRERFKGGSLNFTRLSLTTSPTKLPDMASLVASGLLQNAIKYCTKVVHKTGPAGQRVKYFGHCLTKTHQIWIWRHQQLLISIYWNSKNDWKCRIQRLWAEFIQNGLSKDQEIEHTYRVQSVTWTDSTQFYLNIHIGRIYNHTGMTSLALSVGCKMQLNKAIIGQKTYFAVTSFALSLWQVRFWLRRSPGGHSLKKLRIVI